MGRTIHVSGFPSTATAEAAKRYVERYTGEGSVVAMKWTQYKSGVRRFFAVMQFTTESEAELFLRCAGAKIWYDRYNFLKAKMMDYDMIPRPRSYALTLEQVELNFGCQVSKDRFMVLWKGRGVKLNCEHGLKKMCFEFSYNKVSYKLLLSYQDIWQIQLRRPPGHSSKYLLIQLFAAPKIFEKVVSNASDGYEHASIYYFGDLQQDDQWVRSTDFTSSSCIGQSSGLCIAVPTNERLTYFKENSPYYDENNGQFVLEDGIPYSTNYHQLVPVISPPRGSHLPFAILYKVNYFVQSGCLAGPSLDMRFYQLLDPRRFDISIIEFCLEKLYSLKECCYDPVSWLTNEYRNYNSSRRPQQRPVLSFDDGLVYARRVQVTPCKVYFCGPEVNESNRVLRSYPDDIDNFLRVSFVDENLERVHSTDLSARLSSEPERRRTKIYERVISTLRDGIVIGDKHFEFLAFSSSQLRENSLWMFASRAGLCAADIRRRLGDFSKIKNVAKYAARLGQSLSSSKETLSVERYEVEKIPDVKTWTGMNEYVFSDGIGKISAEFALKVAKKCFSGNYASLTVPSAFQIRYGGYKGVVALDPKSIYKLSLRPSMRKYKSNEVKLDVLAHSKYQPCYLNRQLITLLSTLRVKDWVFEAKQREVVERLDAILTDPTIASEALQLMAPGENTNVLKEMLGCGYKPDSEPYLSMMLQSFRSSKLLELRTKTRIFIPKGRTMMGCLDETRTLDYGQVFLQVSNCRLSYDFLNLGGCVFDGDKAIITGKVVVAKNPCLHPGDVRVLNAINVPDLHHMVDCVVFPQKGKRPHPNECSGSDLDGDLYFVCWDSDLIPPLQVEPMDYTPAPPMELDHEVTIEEVQNYFANYIVNDSLGIISNAHVAFADKEMSKAMSEPCLELAKLFSIAVDFPKTGVPAEIPPKLYVKEFPDFMEKSDKLSYESPNVIGKLFREVKDKAPHAISLRSFTLEVARNSYDSQMEYPGYEDYIADAFYYKGQYDSQLGNLIDYYGIKTEAEILSGNIIKMSRSFNLRKDADAIGMAIRSLRKEARRWFNEGMKTEDGGDDELYAKASAWYHVTYHTDFWGSYNEGLKRDHYISFPWCVYDKLIHIKKENARRARVKNLLSLNDRFRYGLSLG